MNSYVLPNVKAETFEEKTAYRLCKADKIKNIIYKFTKIKL